MFPFSWVNDTMTVKIGNDPGENDLVNKTMVKNSYVYHISIFNPPSNFLYKMGGVVRKIKWISTLF